VKFGLRYASLGRYANGPAAVELAQAAEAAGFDSIWTVEHVVVPHGYQSRYPYSDTGRMGAGLEDFPIAHWGSFPLASDPSRRRTKVHGQERPTARPFSSSRVIVASPRYDWFGGVPCGLVKNAPVTCQLNTSPLTTPSIDAKAAPSGPCTFPLTFDPFCKSTHRVVRSKP
jgi:hypothetical protein